MSEHPIAPSESVPADFADAFDEWIGGATIAKRSVPIYGKPGLYAEFQDLERRQALLESLGEDGGEFAGSESSKIEQRMRELYDEWQASKSTWTVRAVDSDELDELKVQEPALVEPTPPEKPDAPAPLPAKHDAAEAKRFTLDTQKHRAAMDQYEAAVADYEPKAKAYSLELAYRTIAACVVKVEFADGRTIDHVTVEQVRRLRESLGERQILSLTTAAQLAALQEPEIPAPFSPRTSQDETTS